MPALLARWYAPVAVLMLAICWQTSVVVIGKPHLLKIQLQKQQEASTDLPSRLAHHQARARRRALEETGTLDNDFGLGTLALSESLLGVGYGYGLVYMTSGRSDELRLYMTFCSTHYADIYLGIPTQRASMIIDTGSHLTALPCSTCNGCGQHTDPLFDLSKSTTAKYLACHEFGSCSCEQEHCYISQSYLEGSMWQAVMVDELVWVGGLSSRSDDMEGVMKTFGFRFPVGCQTKQTGLFITQKENGIMGLGRHRSTVMSYMLKAGRVTHDLFTLCFADDGGELVFGGVDYSHHTSDVCYTPLLNDNSASYPVHVRDILVNGVPLGIDDTTINSGGGVIVDSGTTDTFFSRNANRRFMKAFRGAAGGRAYSDKSMKLSNGELAVLPIISIVLSGMKGDGSDNVQLDIPASKYLTRSDDGGYYGNFHFSERSGGVLGASTMIGLDVIFDVENKRIGFADSHCGKSYQNRSSASPDTTDQLSSNTAAPIASATTGQPNTSLSNSSNSSTMESNATATVTNDTVGSIDQSTDVITQRSSLKLGAFIPEVILISLMGVALGVMVWTRWRMRAWSRVPDATLETIFNINEAGNEPPLSPPEETLLSPPEETLLSPRSRADTKA